jgi:hypothetical protein
VSLFGGDALRKAGMFLPSAGMRLHVDPKVEPVTNITPHSLDEDLDDWYATRIVPLIRIYLLCIGLFSASLTLGRALWLANLKLR